MNLKWMYKLNVLEAIVNSLSNSSLPIQLTLPAISIAYIQHNTEMCIITSFSIALTLYSILIPWIHNLIKRSGSSSKRSDKFVRVYCMGCAIKFTPVHANNVIHILLC